MNRQNEHNHETALHYAASGDNVEIVKLLLERGADVGAKTKPRMRTYFLWRDARVRGETPLHRAAAWGSPEVIQLLLDAGANPQTIDINKDTPLSYASWHQRDKQVIDMLSYDGSGIGPDLKINGEPALQQRTKKTAFMNTNGLPQEQRDKLATAIEANDAAQVQKLLEQEPHLANADLRAAKDRDGFSHGHPLHRACEHNHTELAELLLAHGSDPDGPGADPEDRPEHGMPLHFAAAEHQNYRLANILLDHGATPNSYPNCDKATIERMFYDARETGLSNSAVRRSFAPYLSDQAELESETNTQLVFENATEAIRLFARMVDLGAQPPLKVLVREGFHDLAMEIVSHRHDRDGTPHDHPRATVLANIFGAARWYGYPTLVQRLQAHPCYQYSYGDALDTIGVAIGSHNRDGAYADYREIIVMQLEAIKSHGDLETAQKDPDFKPLYQIATDFTWHRNYGYRAAIAKPESYVDLADLFVSWGFHDIEYRDPKTNHSPLSAAVKRGHHPGIATYIRWLLEKGAELRDLEHEDTNPIAIAKNKELTEIRELLVSFNNQR